MEMIPDWLKEIQAQLKRDVEYWTDEDGSEQVIVRDQRLFGHLLTNTPKLISALKLAIEGLEDIADFDRKIDLEVTLNDYRQSTMEAPAELVHMETAREILEKIQRGER